MFYGIKYALKATLSSLKEKKKKKKRCDFITKHLTDFAMLYVSSLVLIMLGKFKIKQS